MTSAWSRVPARNLNKWSRVAWLPKVHRGRLRPPRSGRWQVQGLNLVVLGSTASTNEELTPWPPSTSDHREATP